LTQALARHFDEVCGVDISPSMIEAAQRYNRYGARCRYYLNAADHLGLFPDGEFDFIYTNIVLQHMAPRYAKNYIAEFIRVLRPGGLLIFQLPSAMVEPNPLKKFLVSWAPESLWRFYRAVKHRVLDWFRRQPRMEMYGIVTDEVARFIQQQNARLVEFKLDQRPTANRAWICYLYSVTKPA
jgi:ubiquinone/menaquinone biosynthesis C-methylase UbiE